MIMMMKRCCLIDNRHRRLSIRQHLLYVAAQYWFLKSSDHFFHRVFVNQSLFFSFSFTKITLTTITRSQGLTSRKHSFITAYTRDTQAVITWTTATLSIIGEGLGALNSTCLHKGICFRVVGPAVLRWINWRWRNGVPLCPITLFNYCMV